MPDLFAPYTLKGVTLRNRIVMSPMTMYNSVDGYLDDYHVSYLGARAAGGFSLVFPEQIAITPKSGHSDILSSGAEAQKSGVTYRCITPLPDTRARGRRPALRDARDSALRDARDSGRRDAEGAAQASGMAGREDAAPSTDCTALMSATRATSMLVQPRDRSLIVLPSPCRMGPRAMAPASRSVILYAMLPASRLGNTKTFARPGTAEPGAFARPTSAR